MGLSFVVTGSIFFELLKLELFQVNNNDKNLIDLIPRENNRRVFNSRVSNFSRIRYRWLKTLCLLFKGHPLYFLEDFLCILDIFDL